MISTKEKETCGIFFLILKKLGFIFRERMNIQSIQHLHFMTFIFDISLHLEKGA